jgi:nitrite reductase (NO-forming)
MPTAPFLTAAAVVLLSMSSTLGAAVAGGSQSHSHDHGAARGTLQDPLAIARDPSDLPPPAVASGPRKVAFDIETVEVNGRLDDGTVYHYWTFGGKVPGPFLRISLGDTVELRLTNAADSELTHSIDLHAVTGPGGGAATTQAAPGETKSFTFKALNPGLYVYHCATPLIPEHIAAGMYGLILVEPPGGLPPVDREFYVMQGEIYTAQSFGTKGVVETSREKLLHEAPRVFCFQRCGRSH